MFVASGRLTCFTHARACTRTQRHTHTQRAAARQNNAAPLREARTSRQPRRIDSAVQTEPLRCRQASPKPARLGCTQQPRLGPFLSSGHYPESTLTFSTAAPATGNLVLVHSLRSFGPESCSRQCIIVAYRRRLLSRRSKFTLGAATYFGARAAGPGARAAATGAPFPAPRKRASRREREKQVHTVFGNNVL